MDPASHSKQFISYTMDGLRVTVSPPFLSPLWLSLPYFQLWVWGTWGPKRWSWSLSWTVFFSVSVGAVRRFLQKSLCTAGPAFTPTAYASSSSAVAPRPQLCQDWI